MRVALCLSGQPRFLERAYEEVIKPYILDAGNVDTFIHTWEVDSTQVGSPFINGGGHVMGSPVESDIIHKVLELYQPKAFSTEPQIQFEYGKYSDRTLPGIRSDFLYSQFYSVWASNQVRKQYQSNNDVHYDWVIRSRFDVQLNAKLNFSMDNSNLYVPAGCFSPEGYVDCFAMSSPSNMDVYCEFYNNIDDIMSTTSIGLCGELILRQHLDRSNIQTIPTMWHSLYR